MADETSTGGAVAGLRWQLDEAERVARDGGAGWMRKLTELVLADVAVKRQILDLYESARDAGHSAFQTPYEAGRAAALEDVVGLLAASYTCGWYPAPRAAVRAPQLHGPHGDGYRVSVRIEWPEGSLTDMALISPQQVERSLADVVQRALLRSVDTVLAGWQRREHRETDATPRQDGG